MPAWGEESRKWRVWGRVIKATIEIQERCEHAGAKCTGAGGIAGPGKVLYEGVRTTEREKVERGRLQLLRTGGGLRGAAPLTERAGIDDGGAARVGVAARVEPGGDDAPVSGDDRGTDRPQGDRGLRKHGRFHWRSPGDGDSLVAAKSEVGWFPGLGGTDGSGGRASLRGIDVRGEIRHHLGGQARPDSVDPGGIDRLRSDGR